MRRLMCLVLLGSVLTAIGCAQSTKEVLVGNQVAISAVSESGTMTENYTEHMHRVTAQIDREGRALMEDWDLLWQRERSNRLSRWHVR
ncbi:MAG TPA: hypothetical protein VM243_02840 [Phycisphaerae bacterium]|nr:hypothetical protein [Phycisphaerae bacterium]